MATDFIRPTENPALVGMTRGDWRETVTGHLEQLEYKVHCAEDNEAFLERFRQAPYPVVVVEEGFAGGPDNPESALTTLQRMAMPQRRHAVIILVGESFETLNSLQAFQQSVHAVVHPDHLADLPGIVQRTITETEQSLEVFRETQRRLARGEA